MASHESPQASQDAPHILAGRTWRMMREAHGMDRKTLALMVGVTPHYLGGVERGQRRAGPSLENRLKILFASLPGGEHLLPPRRSS